jgi:hypothetical protein
VFTALRNKPFWIWDQKQHEEEFARTSGQCCFNDICGRPLKDKVAHPIYDYEKILYDALISKSNNFKDKHLWVKKATGLGVTELMLRLMAWLCTSGDGFPDVDANGTSQMCIVTGPNIDMAIKLIRRLKNIFERK